MACSPAPVSVSQCGHTQKLTHPHTEAPMWGMPLLPVDAAMGVFRVVRAPRSPKGRPRRTSASGHLVSGKSAAERGEFELLDAGLWSLQTS